MKKLVLMAVAVALMAGLTARAQTVTNINVNTINVAIKQLGSDATPELIRVHIPTVARTWERSGGAFQLQRVDIASVLPDSGTVIISRVNGSVSNVLTTVTASSGKGSADLVDSYGVPNALLVYGGASNGEPGTPRRDSFVIGGTATNVILELKGVRFD